MSRRLTQRNHLGVPCRVCIGDTYVSSAPNNVTARINDERSHRNVVGHRRRARQT